MKTQRLEDALHYWEQKLEDAERDAILMEDEAFVSWVEEQVADAERRAIAVVFNHKSNYEKAMSAGILRYWRSKSGELHRNADPERRQQIRKKLEELNGRLGKNASRQSRRSDPIPFGEF